LSVDADCKFRLNLVLANRHLTSKLLKVLSTVSLNILRTISMAAPHLQDNGVDVVDRLLLEVPVVLVRLLATCPTRLPQAGSLPARDSLPVVPSGLVAPVPGVTSRSRKGLAALRAPLRGLEETSKRPAHPKPRPPSPNRWHSQVVNKERLQVHLSNLSPLLKRSRIRQRP
jgi:hypothetical protein